MPEQAAQKSFDLLKAYPDHCRCLFLYAASDERFLRAPGGGGVGTGNTLAREMTRAACAIIERVMWRCHPVQLRTS